MADSHSSLSARLPRLLLFEDRRRQDEGQILLLSALCEHGKDGQKVLGEERKENMAEAFRSDQEIVYGKIILIIDDVITTGSTINACSKAMIESGAENVFGLTLARSAHL